eukprot:3735631-Karenia_brevis.AAC.1
MKSALVRACQHASKFCSVSNGAAIGAADVISFTAAVWACSFGRVGSVQKQRWMRPLCDQLQVSHLNIPERIAMAAPRAALMLSA